MCDCIYGKELTVKAPSWSKKDTISIDKCIVPIIKILWENGIHTLGSCCGHNKINPSVVLHDDENPTKTIKLLEKYDTDRRWDVFQWRLVNTNKEPSSMLKLEYISEGPMFSFRG